MEKNTHSIKYEKGFPKKLKEAMEYVKDNEQKLKNHYGTNYIAISGKGEIIDFDEDKSRLIKRIYRTNPSKRVLIMTIDEIINPRMVELPSPEFCR